MSDVDPYAPPRPRRRRLVAHEPDSPALRRLKFVALFGTIAAVLTEAVGLSSLQSRQGYAFFALAATGAATTLLFVLLLRRSVGVLLKHANLLLPLGLLVTFDTALYYLATVPLVSGFLHPSWTFSVLASSYTLSGAFLLGLVSSVFFGCWTMLLVLQAVRDDRVEPLEALSGWPEQLWRTFVVMSFGWGVTLFVVGALFWSLGSLGLIYVSIVTVGVLALLWNFATAAILPVALARSGSLIVAIREGVGVSLKHARAWALPLLSHLLLLGLIVLLWVSYQTTSIGSFHQQSDTVIQVNGFWLGAFEDSSRWYTKLMQTVRAPEVGLVSLLFKMLLTVVAIVMKIEIVSKLRDSGVLDEEPSLSSGEFGRGSE